MKSISKNKRFSHGFSLVELVIVILIIAVLAVAVFAGGSITIAKSRDKRVTSDFHNFEVGIENCLYSNQQFQNGATLTTLAAQQEAVLELNPYLSESYAFDANVLAPATGDICNTDASLYAFPSEKLDPWGNPYYFIADSQPRNEEATETYITVFSAGENGKADMGGTLDSDDQFLLVQFINGEVLTKSYRMEESPVDAAGKILTAGQTRLSSASGVAPVNKAVTMAASSGGTTGGGSSSGGSSGSTTPSRPSEGGGSSSGGSSGGSEGGNSSATVCTHAYTLTSMKQATCNVNGEETYTCSKCGNVYTKSTPKLEHNYSMIVSRTPSCALEGEKKYTCSNCGDVYTEPIAKIAHSYGKTSTIASTCTVAGKEIYKCKTCTDSYEKALPLINHKYGTDHKCTMCGKRDPNYTPPAPTMAASSSWYKSSVSRNTITKITFVDSYTTTGAETESWNADAQNVGDIKCYRTGTEIIIAGNGAGKIKANENSSYMFSVANDTKNAFAAVTAIDNLNILDTSNVVNMNYMFANCKKLVNLNLDEFGTNKATNMAYMFNNCASLESLDLSKFNTKSATTLQSIFNGCAGLTKLDLSGFDTKNVTSMGAMFQSCKSLTHLDLSGFDTSNIKYMNATFYGCSSLTDVKLSNFDTSKVINMGQMFYGCTSLTSIDVSSFDTSNVTNMSKMFYNCKKLQSIDVSNFNTKNVKDMNGLFSQCNEITSLDVSKFNTANVTDMSNMFSQCTSLAQLDLSSFDTGKVTDMDYMFFRCSKLSSLDLSMFDTGNVKYMGSMFCQCSNLKSINVLNFKTSKVIDMSDMFASCTSLKRADLSSFETTSLQNMRAMFEKCSNITVIDLSNANTDKVMYMATMFYNCFELKTIYVSEKWSTASVNDSGTWMFDSCSKLVGDIAFNPSYKNKTYAKASGGYLTLKTCEHEYVETVTKEASCTATGIKQFVCSKCADSYTETIPMAAHSYNENNVCTVCGKGSNSFVPGKIVED